MTDPSNVAGLSSLIDATAATVVTPPLEELRVRRVRRHRRRAALGLVVVALAGGASGGLLNPSLIEPVPPATTPVAAPSPPLAHLFEWRNRAVDCDLPSDIPRHLAQSAFAFDGSVTAIQPGPADTGTLGSAHTSSPGSAVDESERDTVTFTVHEWFRGRTGTATVTLAFPRATPVSNRPEDTTRSYAVGTRILVRGTISSGGVFPHQAVIAEICGPSDYHDAASASIWREYYAAHP